MDEGKSTIFISWSKDLSKDVAKALEKWLPNIFDRAKGWVSDTAIDAGSRTYEMIAGALAQSVFGIIVVTRVNQDEPWLNYEAGALSNKFGAGGQTCVAPLLVDFANKNELTSPIKQYQANLLDLEGVHKLCKSIAPIMDADLDAVAKRVDAFWPTLMSDVEEAKQSAAEKGELPPAKPRGRDEVMDEILSSVRELVRRGDGVARPSGDRDAYASLSPDERKVLDALGPTGSLRMSSKGGEIFIEYSRSQSPKRAYDAVRRLRTIRPMLTTTVHISHKDENWTIAPDYNPATDDGPTGYDDGDISLDERASDGVKLIE